MTDREAEDAPKNTTYKKALAWVEAYNIEHKDKIAYLVCTK